MRTKRKFLASILGGLAVLSMALAFVFLPVGKAKDVVFAESTDFASREVYTYAITGDLVKKNKKYESATDSIYDFQSNGTNRLEIAANPWEKIIKTTIYISEFGPYGLQFFGGNISLVGTLYAIPGINVTANKIEVYNRWSNYSKFTYATGNSAIRYTLTQTKTLEEDSWYNVEYAFANDMDEGVITGYTIYFKMTDMLGNVIVNSTQSVLPNIRVINEVDTIEDFSSTTSSQIGAWEGAQGNVFSLAALSAYQVDALEEDHDISYYWNRPNNKPIVITEKYRTTYFTDPAYEWLCGDAASERFLAPGYNKRLTFRFQGSESYEAGKYAILMGYEVSKWGNLQNTFILDFNNKKLAIVDRLDETAPYGKEVAWNGDITKAYDIGISVRKVTDAEGVGRGAVLKFDVTEAGTTETVTVEEFIRLGGNLFNEQSKLYHRFKVFSGVVRNNAPVHDSTLQCTISAINPHWNATFKDGNQSTKTRVADATLPNAAGMQGKTFVGWASGNTFYQAGDTVKLTADTTFTATYAEFGIFETAAVRVQKGANGNETGLRFKGYVNVDDWNALKAIDPDVELVMGIEREDGKQVKITITEDQLYDVEGRTYKEFAVVVSITEADEAYYSTVYAAKTFVGVTYGDDAQVTYVSTNETSRNSVQNIASAILRNDNHAYDAFLTSLTTEQRTLLEAFAAGADAE